MTSIKYNLPLMMAIFIFCTIGIADAIAPKSVLIYKIGFDGIRQRITSNTLAWETFDGDENQLKHGVKGGKYYGNTPTGETTYVCRAKIEGIYSSGTTKPDGERTVCVSSYVTVVRDHHAFEILVNRNGFSKLTWFEWNKFSGIPNGSVAISDSNSENSHYIARYRVKGEGEREHHLEYDYIVGRFDPFIQLGKIMVYEGHSERDYEEGEILTETEPARYVLSNIVYDKIRTKVTVEPKILGERVLSNDKDVDANVDTVISYMYDKEQFWGTNLGLAKALETTVQETSGHYTMSWGIKDIVKTVETKVVALTLQPGTAANVTLHGSYTITEGPYEAKLRIFFDKNPDVSDQKPPTIHKLKGFLERKQMLDVKIVTGPIYWIHNQTFVPTTTTTTTSTTTTTEPTTTSQKAKPLESPIDVSDNEITLHDAPEQDDIVKVSSIGMGSSQTQSEKKKNEDKKDDSNAGKTYTVSLVIMAIGSLLSVLIV